MPNKSLEQISERLSPFRNGSVLRSEEISNYQTIGN